MLVPTGKSMGALLVMLTGPQLSDTAGVSSTTLLAPQRPADAADENRIISGVAHYDIVEHEAGVGLIEQRVRAFEPLVRQTRACGRHGEARAGSGASRLVGRSAADGDILIDDENRAVRYGRAASAGDFNTVGTRIRRGNGRNRQ